MSRTFSRISVLDGSAFSVVNALKVGLLLGVVIPTAAGALVAAVVTDPGTLYTSLPTVTAPEGSADAVLAAHMQVEAIAPAAAGTGYVPNDTITTTGGTAGTHLTAIVETTKLITVAANAPGTGFAVSDTVGLTGGSTSDPAVVTVATTKLVSAAVNARGAGYALNNTITLAGGTFSSAAILTVNTLELGTLLINAAGVGYVIGDTITLAGGTFTTAAVLTALTVGGAGELLTFSITNRGNYTVGTATPTQGATSGIGTGATFQTGAFGVRTFTISTPGSYTVNSAAFTQSATSGAGTGFTANLGLFGILTATVTHAGVYAANSATFTQGATSGGGTGATFQTAVYGVQSLSIANGGDYTVLGTSPKAQGSTSGAGINATITISSWNVRAVAVTSGGVAYDNGTPLTFTGGGGSGADGVGTTGDVDEVVSFEVQTITELPENYAVFVTPDGPAFARVTEKTAQSFRVTLSPETGAALAVAACDILVVG